MLESALVKLSQQSRKDMPKGADKAKKRAKATISDLVSKKLTGRALARFEAKRDIGAEILEGVREIKAGGGKRVRVKHAVADQALQQNEDMRPEYDFSAGVRGKHHLKYRAG